MPKTINIKTDDLRSRILAVRKKAPKHSPLGHFFNSYPEYDNKKGAAKVRNVWNGLSSDAIVTGKMEKLFNKSQ